MGYYISLEESNALLPKSACDEALRRFRAMNETHGDRRRGSAYSEGKLVSRWFAWMPEDPLEWGDTAAQVLEQVGFYVTECESGFTIDGYDKKSGDQDVFIEVIADLLEPSHAVSGVPEGTVVMQWEGEDHEVWRMLITAKGCTTQWGAISVTWV